MMETLRQNICVASEHEFSIYLTIAACVPSRATAAHLQPNVFITVFPVAS